MDAAVEGEQLLAGTRALEAADWATARAAFEAVLDAETSAEALEGLGLALWFQGDVAAGIAAREQAVAAYAREHRCDDAARVAVWVSHQHAQAGRASAARGWLARAERMLEDVATCAGHGWVAVERARHAATVDEQVASARRALDIARATGAEDLEVFAVSVLGRAEMAAGRVVAGLRLLEEALAGASAGRVRNVHTLAEAYCNLVVSSTSAGEWELAAEWCELVETFAREHHAAPLFGACRTAHAEVLLATGQWPEAERALQTALDTHARYVPQMGAPTVATLAELRVRQGRLGEAAELLAGREEHPSSLRALALLRMAEQRPRVALSLLERGLRSAGGDAARATQLLAALVEAALACEEVDAAAASAEQLARLAEETGMRLAAARANLAAAHVALARSQAAEAADPAQAALAGFAVLAMPFDAAEARLALAGALAGSAPEVAEDEARTAFATFRDLGASRAMDAAAAVLRGLGAPPGRGSRAAGELTPREQEVLELIALGMSNARIAQTLVISEKTAGHHVSRILSKLGVHNRAEAAAVAVRAVRSPAG